MTPREAGEAAFYECEGNNAACLKEAFDAYEAAAKSVQDEMVKALEVFVGAANTRAGDYDITVTSWALSEIDQAWRLARAALSKAQEG